MISMITQLPTQLNRTIKKESIVKAELTVPKGLLMRGTTRLQIPCSAKRLLETLATLPKKANKTPHLVSERLLHVR